MASSKAEKRLAAKQIKLEKEAAKKEALIAKHAAPQKVAVIPANPGSRLALNLQYDKNWEDRVGKWGWGQARDWYNTHGDRYVYDYLDPYCEKCWREIEEEKVGEDDRRNKAYDVNQLCIEAQQRLIFLKHDDQDRIFRFRLRAKERLYGFIVGSTFMILWLDIEHKIYQKKGK